MIEKTNLYVAFLVCLRSQHKTNDLTLIFYLLSWALGFWPLIVRWRF